MPPIAHLVVLLSLVTIGTPSPIEIIFPLVAENAEIQPKPDDAVDGVQVAPESREDSAKTDMKEGISLQEQISQPEVSEKPKLNILEVLKGMGSAFQLLLRQPNQSEGDSRSDGLPVAAESSEKFREQAEALRSEINKRSGQLQKVVAAAIEANKDKDMVVKRILENLQNRLGQAKQRADKILKEPESGELAVRTLHSINQGMGNLGSLVQHVLGRVNISINFDLKDGSKNAPSSSPAASRPVPDETAASSPTSTH